METSEVYSSGVLNKGEEITDCFNGKHYVDQSEVRGFIVFTNRRFIFLRRPPGWFAKGFNVVMFSSWGDIVSVSTSGLISKRLNLSTQTGDAVVTHVFSCDRIQDTALEIIDNKNNYVEATIIEAKRVIIEEANKDSAMKILQKRLARGEISLEEFHKLIQRT